MKKLVILFLGVFLAINTITTIHGEESLQDLIDQTPENGVLHLQNKTYEGNIVISKSMTIRGMDNTVIKGDGLGNVVVIKAPKVTLESFTVTHSGKDRNSGEEYAGIKVMDDYAVINDISITNSFHGIYLSQAHNNQVSNSTVEGLKRGEIAGQGNGLHVYYSNENIFENNVISGTRDGMFFDYSNHNEVLNNDIKHTRYGLHYMYSDDNRFEKNRFSYNLGGAAIMHSKRIELLENEFSLNQGTRSYGLLLQASDNNLIKDNVFFQNQRGIYIDQSQKNRIKKNNFLQNQIGIEIWASSSNQIFTGNHFTNNIAAVLTLGGGDKNQWSDHGYGNNWGRDIPILDLDQNGVGDFSIQYKSSLYQLIEENELAYLFMKSPAIEIYEKMNEFSNDQKIMFQDDFPLTANKDKLNKGILYIALAMVLIVFVAYKRRRSS